MTDNLFESLKAIYLEEKKKNPEYLKTFMVDLDVYDKDLLLNDTQYGQHWIAILKGSGAGTNLNRCNSTSTSPENHTRECVKDAADNSKFYHIECKGHNTGEITEVTKEQALRLSTQFEDAPGYRPRRISLKQRLEEMLDLRTPFDESPKFSGLSGTQFDKYVCNDNEISAFKISTRHGTGQAIIEVARTKVNPDSSTRTLHDVYHVPMGVKGIDAFDKPKYFKMEMKKSPFAEFTEITKRVFDNSVKKVNAQKSRELTY
ncbi:hypothetical protein DC914_RS28255 [Vibrio parahaemolyticus]|nr:hypothetical protein [Vibrio parahaemolyticus]EJG0181918.1 hypothetical protein [Vibrio parahaemolyticus]